MKDNKVNVENKVKSNDYIKGVLLTAVGGIGWGISGVCGQFLFMQYNMDASWLTSVRMLFSGLILLTMSIPKGPKAVFGVFRKKNDALWLFAFAIAGLLLCQYSFLAAVKYSNSGTATVLQSLNVVIMAVIVAAHSHTKMDLRQIISILLAVAGTYLVATNGDPGNLLVSARGSILGLLSAIGVVVYTLLSQRLIKSWGNIVIIGWGMLIGGVILSFYAKVWLIPSNFDMTVLIVVAIIVVIGTAIGFSLFLEGVKYIGPVKGTLIGCLEPATATVLSAALLGTKFGVMELAGFCAIIATVFISTLRK